MIRGFVVPNDKQLNLTIDVFGSALRTTFDVKRMRYYSCFVDQE